MKSKAFAITLMLFGTFLFQYSVRTHAAELEGVNPTEEEIYNHLRPAPLLPPGIKIRGAHRAGQTLAAEKPHLALSINFSFASAEISPDSQDLLSRLGSVMARSELIRSHFEIIGHTDAVGTPQANQRLSLQRADAVRDFLIHNCAIEASRLSTEGRGEADPLNLTDLDAAENRRVEVINLGP
jgi:outer membrane protein OmpA-like peptidoglycan-associated protein